MDKDYSKTILGTIATIISRVFDLYNGQLLIVLMAFLLSYAVYPATILWTILYVIVLVLIPLAGDFFVVHSHEVSDWDLSTRKERIKYVHLDAIMMLMLFILSISLQAPPAFIATSLILFVVELIYAWVTMFWKISIHAQVVSLVCAYMLVFMGPLYAWCMFFIPAIFFARLYLRKHTLGQLVAGTLVTMSVAFIVLKLFHFY